jgi:hypothetical protein
MFSAGRGRVTLQTIKTVESYLQLENMKEVTPFLGLESFYRHMIHRCANKTKPLTELTHIKEDLVWMPQRQEASDELKRSDYGPSASLSKFPGPVYTTHTSCVPLAAVLSLDPRWDQQANCLHKHTAE